MREFVGLWHLYHVLFLEYSEGCKVKGKIALFLISHHVVKNYWELW